MKTTRRAAFLSIAGVLFLANRGCNGTNTGNALCAGGPDACAMPVSIIAPEGTEWRGGAFFDDFGPQIQFDGSVVTQEDGACESHGGTIRGTIPLMTAESIRTTDGGLVVQFQDPRLDLSWPNTRPHFTIDGAQHAAFAMVLDVSPDGMLTASLEAVRIAIVLDAGIPVGRPVETEVGTFRIEGPLSVSCVGENERRDITVASGETATIRCADTIPKSSCDDTVESGWSCSTSLTP